MRIPRPIYELCLRIYNEVHERIELQYGVGMRMLPFTGVLATGGIPVFRELNQAQYDKAITDTRIRSLEHDPSPLWGKR